MFNTVSVHFTGDKVTEREYAYLTDILDLEVGDTVVVDTQHGYKTATVSSLFCNVEEAHKWIVCTVDIAGFKAKLEELKRKQFILKQMKQRAEQSNVMDQFIALAKTDETMAELLKAFNTTTPKTDKLVE